jgi:hypothetical protein
MVQMLYIQIFPGCPSEVPNVFGTPADEITAGPDETNQPERQTISIEP